RRRSTVSRGLRRPGADQRRQGLRDRRLHHADGGTVSLPTSTPPSLRLTRRAALKALLVPLAAAALPLRASAADAPQTGSVRQYGAPGDFVIATAVDITTLDPQMNTAAVNIRVTFNLFDTLVMTGPDLSLEPGLASSWRLIDDRTWEFKLRPGVKFHNGD